MMIISPPQRNEESRPGARKRPRLSFRPKKSRAAPSRGFVLHSLDWGGHEAVQVGDRWMVSSSHDILRAIGEGRGPSRWLVALGYAGWSPGQLEGEMVRHGWHVTPGSDGLLFETPPAERWQAAFAEAGVDARLLTTEGGEA